MNIKVSYNWLKELAPTKLTPEKLAAELSLASAGVEHIEYPARNLEKIVVGRVLEIKTHPNADKLRLVSVDLGGKTLEIVCGGSNLYKGMLTAVAQVGAKIRWHGAGDWVALAPAEIRGVKSEGMICAANEIGLAEAFPHADREVMDLTAFEGVPSGTPLARALKLDDAIFDIEVTTNRPDLLGVMGLAREVAAITGAKFKFPSVKLKAESLKLKANLPLKVKVADKKLCPRYQAVAMNNVKVAPSPWWLVQRLLSAGIRPINNIVDITNYVMLLTAQPMHAFDYQKLTRENNAAVIAVRRADEGEKIKALDGVSYKLDETMLVIGSGSKAMAIAGIMGGEESGITNDTTSIVFESANFDATSVRKTSQALNLRSDSSQRFEKGLSTAGTEMALAKAVELAQELAGATIASAVADVKAGPYKSKQYSFPVTGFREFLGAPIKPPEVKRILESLGFKTKIAGKKLTAVVPAWRDHDIEDGRDLVEEVARIYGYHRLPSTLPVGAPPMPNGDKTFYFEDLVKDYLRGAGFTELYTYSFVSEQMLQNTDWNPKSCLKVFNPLSDDFVYMRPSLVPGMLKAIAENQEEQKNSNFFELSKTYFKQENQLPKELTTLTCAVYVEDNDLPYFYSGVNGFYKLKGMLNNLFLKFGLQVSENHPGEHLTFEPWGRKYPDQHHPGRSIEFKIGDQHLGWAGQLFSGIQKKFLIERQVFICELNFDVFSSHMTTNQIGYKKVSRFPSVKRDISFFVDEKTKYKEIYDIIQETSSLLIKTELIDVYKGKNVPQGKLNLTYRLLFNAQDRTLVATEADAILDKIILRLKEKFGASLRE